MKAERTGSSKTQVKICGLSTPETLEAALSAGADLVGLVHFPKSPRHVDLPTAAQLAGIARGRSRIVVLLVDPSDDLVDAIVGEIAPDIIQLHGHETPGRVAEVRARSGCPVMKAIGVATREDVAAAKAYLAPPGNADLILFDAKPPPSGGTALPGGNGLAFDWRILSGWRGTSDFALAGGLDPGNVADAIRLTGAAIVDVSSGVESSPGVKEARLIAEFVRAAKSAHGEPLPRESGPDAGHLPERDVAPRPPAG